MRLINLTTCQLIILSVFLASCSTTGRLSKGKIRGGEVVEAEGSCPIIENKDKEARKCAIVEAQKEALEKVVGVYISAKTRVEKAITIDHNIMANTKGYISGYEMLDEKKQDGFYKTRILARVMFQKIEEDLKNMEALKHSPISYPRVAVLINETMPVKTEDEGDAISSYSAEPIIQALFGMGFKVIDPEAVRAAKAYEKLNNLEEDSSVIAELGAKLNAEILIYGEALTSPIEISNEDLGGLKSYRSTVSIKAVRVQTGELLETATANGSGIDATDEAAAAKSLQTAGEELGRKISRTLPKRLLSDTSITLTIEGLADFNTLENIKKTLASMPGIDDIYLRAFEERSATLEISIAYRGHLNSEDVALALKRKFKLTIEKIEDNLLVITVLP
ncbi:hypothetical protein ACFL6Y_04020 [Elusimicrobiota bacterium]